MQRQQTRDTAAELAVRRLLHAGPPLPRRRGTRPPGLRRRADLVFGPARVAVFIDGCFWHGCPEHGSRPTTANPGYWSEKISKNRARDRDTDSTLGSLGWLVVRAWEHEDPAEVAQRVAGAVSTRRPPRPAPRQGDLYADAAVTGPATSGPFPRRARPAGPKPPLPTPRRLPGE